MLKKRSFLIISTVALLVLLLSGCSADTANGKIEYDHVAMPEETDPYYITHVSVISKEDWLSEIGAEVVNQ